MLIFFYKSGFELSNDAQKVHIQYLVMKYQLLCAIPLLLYLSMSYRILVQTRQELYCGALHVYATYHNM